MSDIMRQSHVVWVCGNRFDVTPQLLVLQYSAGAVDSSKSHFVVAVVYAMSTPLILKRFRQEKHCHWQYNKKIESTRSKMRMAMNINHRVVCLEIVGTQERTCSVAKRLTEWLHCTTKIGFGSFSLVGCMLLVQRETRRNASRCIASSKASPSASSCAHILA